MLQIAPDFEQKVNAFARVELTRKLKELGYLLVERNNE
jgi:hypothetical protein